MKEERMYILNLLGEGKITADEAANLIDALGKRKKREFWDDNICPEERIKDFSKAAGEFAKECSSKMGSAYKGMEPKVKKATKAAMKKTVAIMDDITKSLNESLSNMESRESEDEKKGEFGEDE